MDKKRILLCLFVMTLVFAGCKKLDKLTQFRMEFDESVVIPASTGINLPFDIITPEIETDSETTFSVNDTRKDLVEEIKLEKLTLKISIPSDADFSFLNSVSVFLSAEGLTEIKVAWKENIPANIGDTLELDVTGDDLKQYLLKDSFKLRLHTITDELITSDHHIDIHSVFWVDAKILGQ